MVSKNQDLLKFSRIKYTSFFLNGMKNYSKFITAKYLSRKTHQSFDLHSSFLCDIIILCRSLILLSSAVQRSVQRHHKMYNDILNYIDIIIFGILLLLFSSEIPNRYVRACCSFRCGWLKYVCTHTTHTPTHTLTHTPTREIYYACSETGCAMDL